MSKAIRCDICDGVMQAHWYLPLRVGYKIGSVFSRWKRVRYDICFSCWKEVTQIVREKIEEKET